MLTGPAKVTSAPSWVGQKEEKTVLGHLSLFKHQLEDTITSLATHMLKKCFSMKG